MSSAKKHSLVSDDFNNIWAVLGLSLASFMVVLELPMIFTIWPAIQSALKPSLTQLNWAVLIYILVACVSLVTSWRLSEWLGRRWMLFIGLVIFGLASLSCGLARSISALILFRGLQGLGAAMIFPNTIALICAMSPAGKLDKYKRVWALFNGFGFAVGSFLGGVLSVNLGCASPFLLLFALSCISLLICVLCVRESFGKKLREPVDVFGGVVFTLGLVFLVSAIVQGPAWGWGSLPSLLFFLVAIVNLAIFCFKKRRLSTPLIHLKLLKDRFYRSCFYAVFAMSASMYGVLFILPFYLKLFAFKQLDEVGFLILSFSVVAVIIQPLVRYLAKKINLKLLLILGLLFVFLSFFIQAQFVMAPDFGAVVLALILLGLGLGVIWGGVRAIVFRLFAPERHHLITETFWSWQAASAAIGLALFGAVFRQSQQNYIALHIGENIEVAKVQYNWLSMYLGDTAAFKHMFYQQSPAVLAKIHAIYLSAIDHAYIQAGIFGAGVSFAALVAIIVIKMTSVNNKI